MTTPLDIFNQLWAHKAISVPFYETVNTPVQTDTLPDFWASVMYQPEAHTDVTLGTDPWVEERGQLLVGLMTRSGNGPKALDSQVDEVRLAFQGAYSQGLSIEHIVGPNDPAPDANGEWWVVGLGLRYVYQYQRSAWTP